MKHMRQLHLIDWSENSWNFCYCKYTTANSPGEIFSDLLCSWDSWLRQTLFHFTTTRIVFITSRTMSSSDVSLKSVQNHRIFCNGLAFQLVWIVPWRTDPQFHHNGLPLDTLQSHRDRQGPMLHRRCRYLRLAKLHHLL